jgi:hypothetical protein
VPALYSHVTKHGNKICGRLFVEVTYGGKGSGKKRGAWEQIQAPLLQMYQDFVYLRDHLLLESILDGLNYKADYEPGVNQENSD